MIHELENEEKQWILKTQELKTENKVLKQILIDDLGVQVNASQEKPKKEKKKDIKEAPKSARNKESQKIVVQEEETKQAPKEGKKRGDLLKEVKEKKEKRKNKNQEEFKSDVRTVIQATYVKKNPEPVVKQEEKKTAEKQTEKSNNTGKVPEPKKNVYVPACFRESSEDPEAAKQKVILERAYLTNSITEIQTAVEKAQVVNKEGELDKVIEVCRNREEKLKLLQATEAQQ